MKISGSESEHNGGVFAFKEGKFNYFGTNCEEKSVCFSLFIMPIGQQCIIKNYCMTYTKG